MKKIKATRKQKVGKEAIEVPYAGVFYRIGKRLGGNGTEKIYYVTFKKKGKKIEERVGRQYADQMTPARAANIRADIIEGRRLPKREKKAVDEALKNAEKDKYTVDKLWNEYRMNRKPGKSLDTDTGRYNKYVKPVFGDKEPEDIIKLDVDRVRIKRAHSHFPGRSFKPLIYKDIIFESIWYRLNEINELYDSAGKMGMRPIKLLKKLSPQSVKHVLNLFTWVVNYGTKNNLCQGVSFHIQKPSVNNEKTEDLTPEQLERLLSSIEEDSNIDVGKIMKVALFTGMRRMEILRLTWKDLNFETGFISIRGPKGGEDQKIPMNETARGIFKSVVKTGSEYVFPGRGGGQRTTIGRIGQRITKRAGIPKGFRPLHGLRHVYASMLASSGKVDMYVRQRLMTHKSPKMTQRYAHLRDEALKAGAGQIDEIMKQANEVLTPITGKKIVNLK